MSPTAASLLIGGALLEFAGIVAIAWPDLVPYGERLSSSLRRGYRRVVDRVRRMLGRPRTQTIYPMTVESWACVFSPSLLMSVEQGAGLERKVEFLLSRDQDAQNRLNDLTARLEAVEEGTPERIDEVRGELKDYVAAKLAEAGRRHQPLRVLGTALLFAGLALTVAASVA